MSTADREAILASMPHYNEWGLVVALAAPKVAAGGASENLSVEQKCHLFPRVLVAEETIKENKGPDALVHHPRWSLRPSDLPTP
jgi:hypothetical protein